MRLDNLFGDAQLARLKQILVFIAIVDGVSLAALGLASGSLSAESARVHSELGTKRKALTALPPFQPPKQLPISDDSPQGNAVTRVQIGLSQSARKHGAKVQEFQSSPDPTPYVSTFQAKTDASGWDQISVKVTITGGMRAVMSTLADLSKPNFPIEPDTLEVSRTSIVGTGSAVTSTLTFRILQPRSPK